MKVVRDTRPAATSHGLANMTNEMEEALRYRNKAGTLRAIAAEELSSEQRDMLISVAREYEHRAEALEAIEKAGRGRGTDT